MSALPDELQCPHLCWNRRLPFSSCTQLGRPRLPYNHVQYEDVTARVGLFFAQEDCSRSRRAESRDASSPSSLRSGAIDPAKQKEDNP